MTYVMNDYRLARSRVEEYLRRAHRAGDGRAEDGTATSVHRLRQRSTRAKRQQMAA